MTLLPHKGVNENYWGTGGEITRKKLKEGLNSMESDEKKL